MQEIKKNICSMIFLWGKMVGKIYGGIIWFEWKIL